MVEGGSEVGQHALHKPDTGVAVERAVEDGLCEASGVGGDRRVGGQSIGDDVGGVEDDLSRAVPCLASKRSGHLV